MSERDKIIEDLKTLEHAGSGIISFDSIIDYILLDRKRIVKPLLVLIEHDSNELEWQYNAVKNIKLVLNNVGINIKE